MQLGAFVIVLKLSQRCKQLTRLRMLDKLSLEAYGKIDGSHRHFDYFKILHFEKTQLHNKMWSSASQSRADFNVNGNSITLQCKQTFKQFSPAGIRIRYAHAKPGHRERSSRRCKIASVMNGRLKSYTAEFGCMVRTFSMLRFGASILGSNPDGGRGIFIGSGT